MPKAAPIQTNFTAGEISPRLAGRVDLSKYYNACRTIQNMVVFPHGGVTKRPGLRYVAEVKDSDEQVRLIPFEFSVEQAYMIEAGHKYLRFFADQGQIMAVDAYTKLLLHCDGYNSGTTFTDDGDTGHTPVANGDVQMDTSESKFGTASALFDGDGDFISVPDHADWAFSNGALTIEACIRFETVTGQQCLYSQATGTDYITLYQDFDAGKLFFLVMSGGSRLIWQSAAWVPAVNTWYHVALIRGWSGNADDWAVTIDGSALADLTFTDSDSLPDLAASIYLGSMDSAVIIDYGNTAHDVTPAASAAASSAQQKFGSGSLLLDGAADYLTVPDHADWDVVGAGSTTWTIDLWVRHTDHAGYEVYVTQYQDLNNRWVLEHIHGSGFEFKVLNGGAVIVNTGLGGEITDSDWHHVALVRDGDDYGIYKDGVQVCFVNDNSTVTFTGSLYIGRRGDANYYFAGHMDEIRIYEGNPFSAAPNAGLTDTITVPTAAHTSDAGTNLLLHLDTMDFDGRMDEVRISKGIARWTADFTPPVTQYPIAGAGTPYEIASPYSTGHISGIKFTQSADVLYLVHPDYKPRELTRTSHTAWTLTEIDFTDGPYLDENTTAVTITPSAVTGNITLTASSALFVPGHVGALWRIKDGTWGYVEITGYTSSTVVSATVKSDLGGVNAVTTWREGAWSDYRGWPAAISFFEERLFFACTSHQPQTLWGSMAGAYDDFTPGTADDDPVVYTISADQVNAVRWLTPTKKLMIGTLGGEWVMGGTTGSDPVTPSNVQILRETTYGSANIQALPVGPSILFVQRAGRKIRELAYNFDIDGYLAPDMTILSEHITDGGVDEITYQQEPNSVIYAVRGDGVLLGLTYERREDVVGWHKHVTAGEIESVATIPIADGNELWVAVKRTINGVTKRFIEYLTSFDFNSDLDDAFFVDSGLSYDGDPATTISGLDHLIGEEVAVLADGAVITGKTVNGSGEITLSTAASKVHVGLAYTSILETMRVEAGSPEGTSQGKIKRIHGVTARVYEGVQFEIGPDSANLDTVTFDNDALYTGDVDIDDFPGGYETEGRIYIKSDTPVPLTISALMIRMATHDG